MISPDIKTSYQEQITPEVEEKIAGWKARAGNTIMVLHAVQHHYGYVPRNVSMYLARELDIPLARIYEVLTFYNYFKLEPEAENTIQVCTGTACYLKGAGKIVEELKRQLGINLDAAYSGDRRFKIEEVRCIGCCGLAPVLNVNTEVVGRLPLEKVNDIVQKLRAS